MDIILNFFTTYMNPKTGTEVIEFKKIVANYVFAGRFWVDLAASVPFELLLGSFVSSNSLMFQIFGLLKLVRLLRLGRILTYMKFKTNLKIGFRIF